MSEHERLVAIGGRFDGKLMPPTVAGLPHLRMPVHEPISAETSGRFIERGPTGEMVCEDYTRGEMHSLDKTFAFWLAKDVTYADAMQRLLNRYCYERD